MLIIIYGFFYIITVIADRVLYVEYLHTMSKYSWMISFIIFPVLNFITLSFFVIYSWYKKKLDNPFVHQKHLFLFGILNLTYGFLYTLSIPNISLVSYTVSSKINFFLIMSFSYYFLKRRYRYTHVIGAFLCLVGVLITVVKNSEDKQNSLAYTLLFILATILDTVSIVYKEHFIKKIPDLDFYRFSWNVNIWQIFWSCILFFTVFFPEFNHTPVDKSTLGKYLSDGLKCEFNSSEGSCKNAVIYLFVSQAVTLLIILIEYVIVKNYSSMAINLLVCLKGPLFLMTMYLLIQHNSVEISKEQSSSYTLAVSDYLSLVLTFVGSVIYFLKREYTYKPVKNNDLLLSLTT